jgi:prophage regulatory protein
MSIDTLEDTVSYRLLRITAVCAVSGLARSTLYRRVADGLWTSPVSLGPRSVGWPAAEVASLNSARIAGQSDDEIRSLVKHLMEARKTPAIAPIAALAGADRPSAATARQEPGTASAATR